MKLILSLPLTTLFADSDNNTNKIQPDQIITQKLSSPFLISAQNYLNEAQSRLEQQKSEDKHESMKAEDRQRT